MDKTEKLGLNLPKYNEYADVEILNENFRILDNAAGAEDLERIDEDLQELQGEIKGLQERVDVAFMEIKGARYEESKNAVTGVWTTTAYVGGAKIAEKIDNPKNAQGKYIVVINLYEDGVITETITITEWKDGTGKWIKEVS